jgi:hypothetical protein
MYVCGCAAWEKGGIALREDFTFTGGYNRAVLSELGDKIIRPVASFVVAIHFKNPHFFIHGVHWSQIVDRKQKFWEGLDLIFRKTVDVWT